MEGTLIDWFIDFPLSSSLLYVPIILNYPVGSMKKLIENWVNLSPSIPAYITPPLVKKWLINY
jgi:hypothetical protein